MRPSLILFLLWAACLFLPAPCKADQGEYTYNLSVAAMFQDEAAYLKEWIEYHRLVGVEHFYLYNHNSKDRYRSVLRPYIREGIVEYVDFSGPGFPQKEAVRDALKKSKGVSKWLAVIDTDEFFFPKQHRNLQEFLSEYEEYAAVSVNWQCFGTSHVPHIPPGQLLTEHLVWKAPVHFGWNTHVKCILRPERVQSVVNAHCFTYHTPYFAVRPDRTKQRHSHESKVQADCIVLNHYWTRDEHFFYNVKVPRCRRIKGWSPKKTKSCNRKMNALEDRELVEKYIESLRKVLN